MAKAVHIRPSMLEQWVECQRWAAAKYFRKDFERAGFQYDFLKTSVAAAVGTGVHAAIAKGFLKPAHQRREDKDSVEFGINEFDRETAEGFIVDPVTPSKDAAYKTIGKLYKAYMGIEGVKLEPTLVEQELGADLIKIVGIPGYHLIGRPDHLARRLDDTKTGLRQARKAIKQGGSYLILAEANGFEPELFATVFLKRVPVDKDAERPVVEEYPYLAAKQDAVSAIKQVVRTHKAFAETGDPLEFTTNPNSWACKKTICPLWGSETACQAWKTSQIKSQCDE